MNNYQRKSPALHMLKTLEMLSKCHGDGLTGWVLGTYEMGEILRAIEFAKRDPSSAMDGAKPKGQK